ncbi:MAG: hypothetical protein D6737_02380 [Chloroflexi bacterium]|nr:MAG: hypothetical protein D6737_02380 [Chloroflexota bacterium]
MSNWLVLPVKREWLIFGLIALIGAFIIVRATVSQPGYTDAFYHFNAAKQIVSGNGLTDAYLWNYIGVPDELPAPSHLYWMPLTSLSAAAGMWLFGDSYRAAQFPFALMLAGTIMLGFYLGNKLGNTRRHAWGAGLLTLFSGFFIRWWGATDTFAPYAFVGALALVAVGLGAEREDWRWFGIAGVMAGLGHLTRADGLLLLIVAIIVILWPYTQITWKMRMHFLVAAIIAYAVVMLPWFIRNLDVIGTPLPVGGSQGIWYTSYNDLFNFPAEATLSTFFQDGIGILLSSRWEALRNNLGTFIAVEGLVVMTPLMLIGLWRRRHQTFLRAFWLYALGLHVAMTFVFPFPGFRGGLFHSAAALVPWWAAFGLVGLDDTIDWMVKRRRHWHAPSAKMIFSVGLVLMALALSVFIGMQNQQSDAVPALYTAMMQQLPAESRVMINDPAQLFYYTGFSGVALPNAAPDTIREIARIYDIDYVVIEGISLDMRSAAGAAPSLWSILDDSQRPEFLVPIELDGIDSRTQIYEIRQ